MEIMKTMNAFLNLTFIYTYIILCIVHFVIQISNQKKSSETTLTKVLKANKIQILPLRLSPWNKWSMSQFVSSLNFIAYTYTYNIRSVVKRVINQMKSKFLRRKKKLKDYCFMHIHSFTDFRFKYIINFMSKLLFMNSIKLWTCVLIKWLYTG